MKALDFIIPLLPVCGLFILVLLLGIGINILWLRSIYRKIWTCPNCGAKEGGEIIDTQKIVLSNHMDYRSRKAVRIKETKTIDTYQCGTCQHTWERSFMTKERVRMEDTIRKT